MIFRKSNSLTKNKIDMLLLLAMLGIILIGALCIMSAASNVSWHNSVVRTHLIALPLGFAAFFSGWSINYQIYNEQWKKIYAVALALLIGVLLFGAYQRGSRSWFVLPFFSMQPSEICRIFTILVVAAFLDRKKREIQSISTLFKTGLVVLPIFGLIMLQPDFSSIVVTLPALFVLLFCSGARLLYFLLICLFGGVAGGFVLAWTYLSVHPELLSNAFLNIIYTLPQNFLHIGIFVFIVCLLTYAIWWINRQLYLGFPSVYFALVAFVIILGFVGGVVVEKKMKPHQRKRVETFLSPMADPHGAGYNVLQAQIAMGSGGFLGKGLFSGTQSRLGFVPEKHTDFILAVVGEELGLVGTLGVLALYLLILWRVALIAYLSSDYYGYLVCSGLVGMFFTYMCVNFGMLIGFVPVAGIPLPFISYGGSNLVASLWALGIVQSVYARRLSV